MRTLYLHIGHGKTGSSYLQSSFARSAGELGRVGLLYPEDASFGRAASGGITSGNGMQLVSLLRRSPGTRAVGFDDHKSVLFSSEFLFGFLVGKPGGYEESWNDVGPADRLDRLLQWAETQRFDAINVLLMIRNPIAQAASIYQQRVKRDGYTGSVDQCSLEVSAPESVYRLMELLDARSGVQLTVRNYSVARNALLSVAAQWLTVSPDVFDPPDRAVVNRSLSRGELELQRQLNGLLGPCGDLLSDPLCEELPDVQSEPLFPSEKAQMALWQRLQPAIVAVNARVEAEHQYRFDRVADPDDADRYTFSADQLRVIASGLGAALRRRQ